MILGILNLAYILKLKSVINNNFINRPPPLYQGNLWAFELFKTGQIPMVNSFVLIMLRKLLLHFQNRFSQLILEALSWDSALRHILSIRC